MNSLIEYMFSNANKNIIFIAKNTEQLLYYRNYIMDKAQEKLGDLRERSTLWKLYTKDRIECISGSRIYFLSLRDPGLYVKLIGMTVHVLLFTEGIPAGDRARPIFEIRYRMPQDGIIGDFTDE